MKRFYKTLKKEISNTSAISVGYNPVILESIPSYAILEAIKVISPSISENSSEIEIENMLITECVRIMSYQDFKNVSSFFYCSTTNN